MGTYVAWSWTVPCTRSCDACASASSGSSSTGRFFCSHPQHTGSERCLSIVFKLLKSLTSSLCMGSCCFRLDPEAKALPHLSQTNGRTPVCSLICLIRLLTYSRIFVKYLWQKSSLPERNSCRNPLACRCKVTSCHGLADASADLSTARKSGCTVGYKLVRWESLQDDLRFI